MKKNLFTIVAATAAMLLTYSCSSSDDPKTPADIESNKEVLTLMEKNYYWTLPTNPNTTLETPTFFKSLLNPADSYTDVNGKKYTYSDIYDASKISTTSVDVGFEYAANRYEDGIIYYVVYYVKPGTSAANEELLRGYLISKVNDQAITEANQGYLLQQAAAKGQMTLQVLNPETGKYLNFKINPANNYAESPVYTTPGTTPVLTNGNKKVGYLVYNKFTSGNNGIFEKPLMDKLQEFVSKGANYLVLDLRYNAGGLPQPAADLASAIVKNRNTSETFMYFVGRTNENAYKFANQTSSKISIPTLGNNLEQVYIITSKNTKGISEAFIYALKSYLGDKLVVVGEKTLGVIMATGSTYTPNNQWLVKMVIGKYCNKDKAANYAEGITPNTVVTDIDLKTNVMLKPLGSPEEKILKEVLAMIEGKTSVKTAFYNEDQTGRILGSSLQEKFRNNTESPIELQ